MNTRKAGFMQWISAVLCFVATFVFVTPTVTLFNQTGSPAPAALIAAGALVGLLLLGRILQCDFRPAVAASCLLLICLVFFDIYTRPYSLVHLQQTIGELLAVALLAFALMRYNSHLLYVAAFLSPLLLTFSLLDTAAGEIIFSDDHATFLYRLIMLKENFPAIPFYNPLWNMGIDERYFFATGTLNIFFIAAPFIYLLDLWQYYTLIPITIFFLLVPGCSYFGCRLTGGSPRAACIASILALSSSLGWYQWGLFFGPLGFLTTTALTPLLAALAARILDPESTPTFAEAIGTIVVGTLVLFWSPGGIIFFPAILFGILGIRRLLQTRYVITILVALFCINLPWVLVFWSASNVSSFLEKTEDIRKVNHTPMMRSVSQQTLAVTKTTEPDKTAHKAPAWSAEKSLTLLHRNLQTINPLLVFLAIPALLLFPARYRSFYAAMALWLCILGAGIAPLKPQLELDRMLIVLGLFLSVPVGHFLDQLFSRYQAGVLNRVAAACILAALCITVAATAGIVQRRAEISYSTAGPFVRKLAEQLDAFSDSGRVLFAGFMLHDLNGGHLAPLTTLTKTPLIASSQVHKHWRYKDVIPPEFLGHGANRIEEYFALTNTAAVVSSERTWRAFFFEHPDLYTPVWQSGRFHIFRREKHEPDYFFRGTGKIISQESNRVVFQLDTPDAVLRFTYFPFLSAGSCTVKPAAVSESIRFVSVSGCPVNQPVTLKAKPAYVRISS